MYSITRSGGYELRIDMADFDNATAFAHYAEFSVGRDSVNPDEDGYPLTVDQYSGTAGADCQKIIFQDFQTLLFFHREENRSGVNHSLSTCPCQ